MIKEQRMACFVKVEKTKEFYNSVTKDDLCNCAYCQNYVRQIKTVYLKVADYLLHFGIDIEKPFETMPLEPDECKNIEYTGAQYIVCGEPDDFSEIVIDSVTIHIAKFHPSTELNTNHFVIEISPIRLKWVV